MMTASTKPMPREPDVIIRASAGTGKTFQLSNRYLRLVLSKHRADGILAVTFTRKAAGEILERILLRLARAAASPEACLRLADELNLPTLTIEQCREAVVDLTRNLHRLRVSTLDSFFLQAARSLSLELGLPPNWEIADEHEGRMIQDRAIAALLHHESTDTVHHVTQWLYKGDSKRGVHAMLRDTIRTNYSLYLESPAESWTRLEHRSVLSDVELLQCVEEILQSLDDLPKVLQNAVTKDLERIRDRDWNDFLEKGIGKCVSQGQLTYSRVEIPEKLVRLYEPLVKQAIDEQLNAIAQQTVGTQTILAHFHGHFETEKRRTRRARFSDLARWLAELSSHGMIERMSYRLDAPIDNLLLDEFQDTSLHQWNVLQPIAARLTKAGSQGSVFCVGDIKQAIYGWRGGDADLLDAIGDELQIQQFENLEVSRRSSTPVIHAVNEINEGFSRFNSPGKAMDAVQQWTKDFPRHETALQHLPGYVSWETTPTVDSSDDDVVLLRAAERAHELFNRTHRSSIAVLVRTNDAVANVINYLHDLGVPASEEGGNPLTDSAAVQLILSLLRLADHPGDMVARFHLATSPWSAQLGLTSYTDRASAKRLSLDVRRQIAARGYGSTLTRWSKELEPFCNPREWRRLEQLTELAHRYQLLVEAPRQNGYAHQTRVPFRTDAFVERVLVEKVADPSESRVRVMTVHQAKGLQFEAVILPLHDRNFFKLTPHCVSYRRRSTDAIETVTRYVNQTLRPFVPPAIAQAFDAHFTKTTREELCVFYVALTRAIHGMYIITPPAAAPKANLPESLVGLMRAALIDDDALPDDSVCYETGDPDWPERVDPPATAADAPTQAKKKAKTLALRSQPASGTTRASHAQSPSRRHRAATSSIAEALSRKNVTGMAWGTMMHALLEQITWIDDTPPADSRLMAIVEGLAEDQQQARQAYDHFQRIIARGQIHKLLSRASYQHWFDAEPTADEAGWRLEVRNEMPISVQSPQGTAAGLIDRMILLREGGKIRRAEVIDFKTDRVETAEALAQCVETYREQLAAYRVGVSQMLRLAPEKITTKLAFVADDLVVPLSNI